MRDVPDLPGKTYDSEPKSHNDVLIDAVRAWADAEILSDETYERGTFVGEWHLVVSRAGFNEDGNAVSQTLVIHSEDPPSRLTGLLSEAQLRLRLRLEEHYSGGTFNG